MISPITAGPGGDRLVGLTERRVAGSHGAFACVRLRPSPQLHPRLHPRLRLCMHLVWDGPYDASVTKIPAWPDVPGIAYGGDYNPEQWPEEVWADDVTMMAEAGVNLVTVGVFSWAMLEPTEGSYTFGWLDRVLDLLSDSGIAVDLATATASPPPWLGLAYPESLPVRADGTVLWWGSRQAFCPSSRAYRDAATRLVEKLAERYGSHPALRLWHVHNEYGCHNAHCYCDTTAASFRRWLAERYGTIDALNDVWATTFWGQHYSDFAEVIPPRVAPSFQNPGQGLDFCRFSSDELLECYRAERDVLRRVTPDMPITTNLLSFWKPLDYWTWAPELDLVSMDHYLWVTDPSAHVDLSMTADLTRSLGDGHPWLLMEHSPSAVNWQRRNVAKVPGQMRRNSLTHVARGADGVMFFQWRASRGGAEKFHSAMVPHAGVETKVWREVCELGRDLRALAEVRGSRVRADVAIVLDWPSWWAVEQAAQPSVDIRVMTQVRAWYSAMWGRGVTCDFVPVGADLSGYRVVLVPNLYLADAAAVENLSGFASGGGSVVVGCYSGIVEETDTVVLGGYPGAMRELLGIWIEEFFPLLKGEEVVLSRGFGGSFGGSGSGSGSGGGSGGGSRVGSGVAGDEAGTGTTWSELGRATTAEVVSAYASGPVAGSPAVTRNRVGAGWAWYVGTVLGEAALAELLGGICEEARVTAGVGAGGDGAAGTANEVPDGVEIVRRHGDGVSYLFVMNHGPAAAEIAIGTAGTELLSGAAVSDSMSVAAGGVAVVKQVAYAP